MTDYEEDGPAMKESSSFVEIMSVQNEMGLISTFSRRGKMRLPQVKHLAYLQAHLHLGCALHTLDTVVR